MSRLLLTFQTLFFVKNQRNIIKRAFKEDSITYSEIITIDDNQAKIMKAKIFSKFKYLTEENELKSKSESSDLDCQDKLCVE